MNLWSFAKFGMIFIVKRCSMSEREVKLYIENNAEKIAKEIVKGKDVYITKSASGVVIRKLTVQKVG